MSFTNKAKKKKKKKMLKPSNVKYFREGGANLSHCTTETPCNGIMEQE